MPETAFEHYYRLPPRIGKPWDSDRYLRVDFSLLPPFNVPPARLWELAKQAQSKRGWPLPFSDVDSGREVEREIHPWGFTAQTNRAPSCFQPLQFVVADERGRFRFLEAEGQILPGPRFLVVEEVIETARNTFEFAANYYRSIGVAAAHGVSLRF